MKKLITFLLALTLIVTNQLAVATGVFEKNFTGTQKEYFLDGKPKYEVSVIKGKKQGLETFWYPNGNKNIQTNYVDDLEDGVWYQWFESGKLKLEANYKAGQEHGSFKRWHGRKVISQFGVGNCTVNLALICRLLN
jgi:hypothetical protein